MTVLVVGLSHRSAPVHVLERAAVGATEVPKLLDELLRGQHVSEAVLLSTCNRIEVYAVVDAFHVARKNLAAAEQAAAEQAAVNGHSGNGAGRLVP